MAIKDLQQGLPRDKRVMKEIKQATLELINDGYLILQHTDRVSINPPMLGKIRDVLK